METRSLDISDCSHGDTGSVVLGTGMRLLLRLLRVLTIGNTVHPSRISLNHFPFKLTGNRREGSASPSAHPATTPSSRRRLLDSTHYFEAPSHHQCPRTVIIPNKQPRVCTTSSECTTSLQSSGKYNTRYGRWGEWTTDPANAWGGGNTAVNIGTTRLIRRTSPPRRVGSTSTRHR